MSDLVQNQINPGEAPAIDPNAAAPAATMENGEPRPEWLPEKFKSPEDMAASYTALEQKQGGVAEASEEQIPAEEDTAEDDTGDAEDDNVSHATYGKAVDAALASADMKPADINDEWQRDGKLSDDTYAKLETAGFGKEVVDTYVRGFEQRAASADSEAVAVDQAAVTEIQGVVGGETEYTSLVTWASTNLSQEDADAFDRVVDSGDVGMAKLAVQGLKARMDAAEGTEPNLQFGGTPSGSGGGYASWAEQSAAITAARASGDPAQIKAVEAKSLRSNL